MCSFYGTARESSQDDVKLFEISAEDDRHTELMRLYLGMRDDSLFPPTNRFESKNTVFSLKQKGVPIKEARKADQVRVTWNDYPGEWFEGGATTESEKQDKINTFRNLLGSDVALFLVDGQRLHDYADDEESYNNKFVDNKKGLDMLDFAKLVMETVDQPVEKLQNLRGVAIEKREFLKALTADFTSRLKQAQTDKILVWDFA